MSRVRWRIWRAMTSMLQSMCSWSPERVESDTALPMAASGFRSSCASMARNSSFRLSVLAQLMTEPFLLPAVAALLTDTSWNTRTTPRIVPVSSSLMGAALSSMGRTEPSLAASTVWFASPTTDPLRGAPPAPGFSTGSPSLRS